MTRGPRMKKSYSECRMLSLYTPGKSHRAMVPRMRHSLRLEFDHVDISTKTDRIFSVFIQIYTKL